MSDQTLPHAAQAALPPATCSACFAESLRRMAEWYRQNHVPIFNGSDAIGIVLLNVADAWEQAQKGLVWAGVQKWEPKPNAKFSRAADGYGPETSTPPALAETPCSAVSEGGQS